MIRDSEGERIDGGPGLGANQLGENSAGWPTQLAPGRTSVECEGFRKAVTKAVPCDARFYERHSSGTAPKGQIHSDWVLGLGVVEIW